MVGGLSQLTCGYRLQNQCPILQSAILTGSRQTVAVSTTIGPDVHTRLKGIVASSTEATLMVYIIGE
jgi:hypothetical protein